MPAFLDGDDPKTRLAKIRTFELIFVLTMATEYWARALPKWGQLSTLYMVSLALATILCTAALSVRLRRAAFAGLAATHLAVIWREFPATGNHAYLELIFCLLCSFLNFRRDEEQRLFLRSTRWVVCTIFFYSGLQKMVHGYYFRGQYLAFSLWIDAFRPVLGPLLSPDELTRLGSYTREVGDGPYLVSSPLFLLFSNAVYVVEMALAPLLALRRTRALALPAAALFLIAVEVAAREVFFGIVFLNAILLFARSDLNRKLQWLFVALLLSLMLVRLGIFPEVTFY